MPFIIRAKIRIDVYILLADCCVGKQHWLMFSAGDERMNYDGASSTTRYRFSWHAEAWTKWLTFYRRYFEVRFLETYLLYFVFIFKEMCNWVSRTLTHHWFRSLFGTEWITIHYLNQWWPIFSTQFDMTRALWVNSLIFFFSPEIFFAKCRWYNKYKFSNLQQQQCFIAYAKQWMLQNLESLSNVMNMLLVCNMGPWNGNLMRLFKSITLKMTIPIQPVTTVSKITTYLFLRMHV